MRAGENPEDAPIPDPRRKDATSEQTVAIIPFCNQTPSLIRTLRRVQTGLLRPHPSRTSHWSLPLIHRKRAPLLWMS